MKASQLHPPGEAPHRGPGHQHYPGPDDDLLVEARQQYLDDVSTLREAFSPTYLEAINRIDPSYSWPQLDPT
jgi:hypothetical protein